MVCAHPLQRVSATTSPSRCSTASTSPTTPAPASSIPRPATAARTSSSGWRRPRSDERGIDTRIPYTGRRERRLHRRSAGLRRQARHQRQGREGRRQRGGHQGADRGGRAGRARQAQAPVSAFVAVEEAGHLPQHAAMVHRHGQADRRRATARPCARSRSTPSSETRWVPAAGENRITRHGRRASPTG